MKKQILLFAMSLASMLCQAQSFFNYYDRDEFSGKYVAKNIDNEKLSGFRYCVESDKVIGYYFMCGNVKFIDELSDGKLSSTTYYKRNGEKLAEINYFYNDDGRLSCKKTKIHDAERSISYEGSFFFRKEQKLLKYYSSQYFVGSFCQNTISDGCFSFDYKPMNITSRYIRNLNEIGNTGLLVEEYLFDDSDNFSYKVYNDEKIVYEKFSSSSKIVERSYDELQNLESEKTIIKNKSELAQILKFKQSETKTEFIHSNPERKLEILSKKSGNVILIKSLDEDISIIGQNIYSVLVLESFFEENPYYYSYKGKQEKLQTDNF